MPRVLSLSENSKLSKGLKIMLEFPAITTFVAAISSRDTQIVGIVVPTGMARDSGNCNPYSAAHRGPCNPHRIPFLEAQGSQGSVQWQKMYIPGKEIDKKGPSPYRCLQ